MILEGWLFFGLVGFIFTYAALTTASDDRAIVFGLIGMLTWALFAFQSLHVEVLAGGKTTPETYSYAAVSVWALALFAANLYIVVNGPIAVVDQRKTARDEVT